MIAVPIDMTDERRARLMSAAEKVLAILFQSTQGPMECFYIVNMLNQALQARYGFETVRHDGSTATAGEVQ